MHQYTRMANKESKMSKKYTSAGIIAILVIIALGYYALVGDFGANDKAAENLEDSAPSDGSELEGQALEFVSVTGCGSKGLRLEVGNVFEKDLLLQNSKDANIFFTVNGMVDIEPGCDVDTLAPGDTTICDEVGHAIRVDGDNILVVQTIEETYSEQVTC